MTHEDAVLAVLRRLEADNRMMKRVGGAVLTVLAIALLGSMAWQDPDPLVHNIIRTGKLELTNARGDVVAILQATDPKGVETVVGYHDNGVPHFRRQFFENHPHGMWETWDNQGFKIEEREYRNGLSHGRYTRWYVAPNQSNAIVSATGTFADGHPVGPWVNYDGSTGKKLSEGSYDERGRAIGPWKAWYSNGQMKSDGQYKDGLKDGPWSFWNEDGSVDEGKTGHYVAGELMR